MRQLVLFFVLFSLLGCSSSNPATSSGNFQAKGSLKHIQFEGGDGSSILRAVIIKNAKNSYQGIQAQSAFIQQRYGIRNLDWRMISQELKQERNKTFDVITIERVAAKKEAVLYFDISEFYGKL